MTLFMIAGFLIALGVLFVMMAAQGRKDSTGKRLVPIPPEQVQILSLLFFIAGVATLAYAYYRGSAG